MQLFVDNLCNLDFSYLHPQRGLLGETWLAHISLDGALDDQGMVCDFGLVKKTVRDWLDTEIDHRLVIPGLAPELNLMQQGETLVLEYEVKNLGVIKLSCPTQAVAIVDTDIITEHSLAQWAIEKLTSEFPSTIEQIDLSFSEEEIHSAYYHYSHGLKKHGGNCQRIAHGHRSRIEIWRDEERATDLEHDWADRWRDIYIGTQEDLKSTFEDDGIEYHHYAYQAQQGAFELTLPSQCCYLIDTDSTVENIASHIAEQLRAAEETDASLRIRAYEGIHKGAIASA